MNVSQLIEKLNKYNPNAKVYVITHNKKEDFTLTHGGGEGCSPFSCECVGFYVDKLCDVSERDKLHKAESVIEDR